MSRRETFLRQIRLGTLDPGLNNGKILLRCNMLANWISRHINVRCANFFSPKHDPNIVIFTLNTRPDKDKIAQHPQFPAKLDEYNLKLLPPPREADETTVFVRNLPDSLFLFWETDYPHTLGEACLEFNTSLRDIHTDIDEIHLIQHRTPTSISPLNP